MKSILDPTFRYTPSVETNLRKTFARIRRERARETQIRSTFETMRKIAIVPRKVG